MSMITRSAVKKSGGEETGTEKGGHFRNKLKQGQSSGTGSGQAYSLKDYFGDMAGRGHRGGGGTPTPKSKKSPTPLTPKHKQNPNKNPEEGKEGNEMSLEVLAQLISDFRTDITEKVDEVREDLGEFRTTFDTWQVETEIRLKELEEKNEKTIDSMTTHNRMAAQIDTASSNINLEMQTLRLNQEMMIEQMIVTQAVLKKLAKETNQYGRAIKAYNLRIGNLGSPVVADKRGENNAPKPREDTKHIVAKFIVDYKLMPNKTIDEAKACIDVAFRTGTSETDKPRNILVKFCTVTDRNTVMVNGKIREREKHLEGKYVMDDYTPEDYSQKRRCHAIMKELKETEKRPTFIGGRLRTPEGYVKEKDISSFNKKNKIEDPRLKEITVDNLTMHLKPKGKKKKATATEPIEVPDKETPPEDQADKGQTEGQQDQPPAQIQEPPSEEQIEEGQKEHSAEQPTEPHPEQAELPETDKDKDKDEEKSKPKAAEGGTAK